MKVLKAILLYFTTILTGLVSLAFAFIEIRPVFAGDYKLMENPTGSMWNYIFRFIYFLIMFINVVIVIVKFIKKDPMNLAGLVLNTAIAAGATCMFSFYEWYITLVILLLNIIMLLDRVFLLEKSVD